MGSVTRLRALTARQRKLLDIIDHIIYVVECIAQNTGGEAKYELWKLTETVAKTESVYADSMLSDLREAADLLADRRFAHAVAPLARVRGVLWKELLA